MNLDRAPLNLQHRVLREGVLLLENDYIIHSNFLEMVSKYYWDYQISHNKFMLNYEEEILQRKLQYIEQTLRKLKILRKETSENFLSSFQTVDAAKHNLQVTIEAIVDIANHIVARERYGLPESSVEAVEMLVQNGILDAELAQRLRLMIKFRNRIVHLYQEIDDEQVHKILREDLGDIEAFIEVIVVKFLT